MSDTKLRLYVGSIAAVDAIAESFEVEPFTLLTISLEAAAADARAYAYRRWPVRDRWSGHVAVIAPLPATMYEAFGQAAAADRLDLQQPTENQTLFRFKPEPSTVDRAEIIH